MKTTKCTESNNKRCKICKGIGLIKKKPIICKKCNCNPNGCINCKFGYIQYGWSECNTCFSTGVERKFHEYFNLLHSN